MCTVGCFCNEFDDDKSKHNVSGKGGGGGEDHGNCGALVTWALDDHVLVISGEGEMTEPCDFPHGMEVNTIIISEKVTSIAPETFRGLPLLVDVYVGSTKLSEIGSSAFLNCSYLKTISFSGSVEKVIQPSKIV